MQIVIAALLSVCGLFVLNHIANGPLFLRLSAFQVTLFDVFLAAYVAGLYVYFHLRARVARHERLTRNQVFWVIILSVGIAYLALLSHLYDDEEKGPAIAVTVGFFATLGWLYTNYMNARHQQRAHTMNLLLSLRTNSVLNEHRINFFKRYPPGTKILKSDLDELKTERADPTKYNITSSQRSTSTLDSVQYMLNLYEFICVGMRQGDLDETIIRMSLRRILVQYSETVGPYIEDVRSTGGKGSRVYENYLYYVDRFRDM
jgi:hypothetical protein